MRTFAGLLASLAIVFCAIIIVEAQPASPALAAATSGQSEIVVISWELCQPCKRLESSIGSLSKVDQKLFRVIKVPARGLKHRVDAYPMIMHVVKGKVASYGSGISAGSLVTEQRRLAGDERNDAGNGIKVRGRK